MDKQATGSPGDRTENGGGPDWTTCVRACEIAMVSAGDLDGLWDALLTRTPSLLGFKGAEIWVFDPHSTIAEMVDDDHGHGSRLRFLSEVFSLQELYDVEPAVTRINATDSRMFNILTHESGLEEAVLLPLIENDRLVGSLHFGMTDDTRDQQRVDSSALDHLARVSSIILRSTINREQLARLSLLDPLTEVSNRRGFDRDFAREIARSRRSEKPLSVLMLQIDDYDALLQSYDDAHRHFVVRRVVQRISSDMRATDYLARVSDSRFTMLVASCGEVVAQRIAERVRADIEDFTMDDGRGAVFSVTLSIGMVAWEPAFYPALDMAFLAQQMREVAEKALSTSVDSGGNRVSVSRLSTLFV